MIFMVVTSSMDKKIDIQDIKDKKLLRINYMSSMTDGIYVLSIHKVIYRTLFEILCQLKQPNHQKLKVKTIEGRAINITE